MMVADPRPTHMEAAARILDGHRLLDRLSAGPHGEVWKADFGGRPVAVKVLGGRRPIAQVRGEALAQEALGRIEGPDRAWFPRVEAVRLDHDPPYLRLEYVEGRTLDAHLAASAPPLEARIGLARSVLAALSAVHRRNFVHGDLSPGNVIVEAGGGLKLIDVGCGALFDPVPGDIRKSGTEAEQALGVASPLYAAPERFGAEFAACGRPADVFSFGKLLSATLTGEAPYVVKPLSKRFPSLGAPADDFLFKCVEEQPAARYADAGEALAAFDRAFRAAPPAGEYRAECPECRAKLSIPGGWAGERFPCRGCGRPLEVLFTDEESRLATMAVAGAPRAADPGIRFLEDDVLTIDGDGRARKFCPACGREIFVEARKCRWCAAWVDAEARKAAERETRSRPAP